MICKNLFVKFESALHGKFTVCRKGWGDCACGSNCPDYEEEAEG